MNLLDELWFSCEDSVKEEAPLKRKRDLTTKRTKVSDIKTLELRDLRVLRGELMRQSNRSASIAYPRLKLRSTGSNTFHTLAATI